MIYFWSKYNNITMDFSDFSEFIGPIIFGLIAWLSNYFGKKKKNHLKMVKETILIRMKMRKLSSQFLMILIKKKKFFLNKKRM
ncbi:MAG: hypothetical protein CM15mP41_1640 [Flammeovirgaceae bacterium]|nr:MAG: hypothetical protein CM15mP41_1640 [Flammeovirgaceae bacterium]